MTAVQGSEDFQRLEEFPTFISSIKSFGRPILPVFLTPSRRRELREFRVAAMNKEAEILKRRHEIMKQRQESLPFESHEEYDSMCVHSSVQESCALWCPSSKDSQEATSVAISKLPTYGIYSSVHTGAIVCSNVIGKSHVYNSRIVRDSLSSSEENAVDCIACSKSNINPECSLCQAEHKHSFYNSFVTEESYEVPCRAFWLQQNLGIVDTELHSTEEETEGVSLPTVICNEKYIPFDTDSESNVTFMSQSTDLDKYMGHSFEFTSSDNSAITWDSKSISQQGTLSKSDDASSETIVNTENELTPCASTMTEFTENIEDELSNADEAANISDKNAIAGTLKRAHSVDSYMKMLQSCSKNINVKKSLSEPFNTNHEVISVSVDNTKKAVSPKSAMLIKEDSKESEESKDELEESTAFQEDKASLKEIETVDLVNQDKSFKKKHVRQNSYTLDYPSSALILAHADCTCNLDVNCFSPHCSALKDEIMSNPAFTKEKVEVSSASSQDEIISIPAFTKEKVEVSSASLHHQVKELPSALEKTIDNEDLNCKDISNAVIDDFPVIKEDKCEKSCSENSKTLESSTRSDFMPVETKNELKSADDHLSNRVSEKLILSIDAKHEADLEKIYCEFQENYEKRCKELEKEQQQQWLKLKEEFKEQEKWLYEKLKMTLLTADPQQDVSEEKDQIINDKKNDYDDEKIHEVESSSEIYEGKMSVSSLSGQIPSSDNTVQSSMLATSNGSPQSVSCSKTPVFQNSEAGVTHPGRHTVIECKSLNKNQSASSENGGFKQPSKDSVVSTANIFVNNGGCMHSSRESLPRSSDISAAQNLQPHFVSQPQLPKAEAVPINQFCDKMLTCFCDNTIQQCKCCESVNGYHEYLIALPPGYIPSALEKNSDSYAKDFVNNDAFSLNSSASEFQSDILNHENSFNSSSETNLPTQNSRNCTFSTHNAISAYTKSEELHKNPTVTSTKNEELYQKALCKYIGNGDVHDVFHDKESKDFRSYSSKEKSESLKVSSIVSLCAKSLRNGNPICKDRVLSKRLVTDPNVLKRFEKLPAFVKGYLTRRLFNSEHVQGLFKTLMDSYILFDELSKELHAKGKSISQADVDFYRQLKVQLQTTYQKFYDVFFTISINERMSLISASRNHRLKQKKQESSNLVSSNTSESTLTRKLSSASLTSLGRKNKKRSSIDNRTYTVADHKSLRSRSSIDNRTYTVADNKSLISRTHSSMSSKSSISVSPSSIYLKSISMPLIRKTASAKSSSSQQSHHPKWVP